MLVTHGRLLAQPGQVVSVIQLVLLEQQIPLKCLFDALLAVKCRRIVAPCVLDEILGGKKANAYKDVDLRRKVYRDIYYEVKREYGLIDEKGCQLSYKKLKRKHFKGALAVIAEYIPPIGLQNEITSLNELDGDE